LGLNQQKSVYWLSLVSQFNREADLDAGAVTGQLQGNPPVHGIPDRPDRFRSILAGSAFGQYAETSGMIVYNGYMRAGVENLLPVFNNAVGGDQEYIQ
jgi:hypothetical protein